MFHVMNTALKMFNLELSVYVDDIVTANDSTTVGLKMGVLQHPKCSSLTHASYFISSKEGESSNKLYCVVTRGVVAAARMADPSTQASLQPRPQQTQSSATTGSNSMPGSANCDPARPGLSQQQRASQKKAQVRAFPRAKKLEKLGVFSACKVAS